MSRVKITLANGQTYHLSRGACEVAKKLFEGKKLTTFNVWRTEYKFQGEKNAVNRRSWEQLTYASGVRGSGRLAEMKSKLTSYGIVECIRLTELGNQVAFALVSKGRYVKG